MSVSDEPPARSENPDSGVGSFSREICSQPARCRKRSEGKRRLSQSKTLVVAAHRSEDRLEQTVTQLRPHSLYVISRRRRVRL